MEVSITTSSIKLGSFLCKINSFLIAKEQQKTNSATIKKEESKPVWIELCHLLSMNEIFS